MNTLEAQDKIDFWNLNNGITLLTSSATLYDDTIEAENIQIVNGLQTTNTIFNYFSNGGTDGAKRSVLVKIIVSTEPLKGMISVSVAPFTGSTVTFSMSTVWCWSKQYDSILRCILHSSKIKFLYLLIIKTKLKSAFVYAQIFSDTE